MKLFFISLIGVVFSNKSLAHCPNEFRRDQKDYCLSYHWENAQVKRRGEVVDIDELSPVINNEGLDAFRRKTSTAFFKIWEKGDATHKSIYFKDFRVFPYMVMMDGSHHDASSKTNYVKGYRSSIAHETNLEGYLVSEISFLDMKVGGCWSFRMSFDLENIVSTSLKIANIESYTNISNQRNMELLSFCEICSEEPSDDDGDDDGHGSHHH